MLPRKHLIALVICAASVLSSCKHKEEPNKSVEFVKLDHTLLALTIEADHLDVPWDLQYDQHRNAIVFSEIAGKIKRLNLETGQIDALMHISDVYHKRTLGLLGMAIYQPESSQNYLFVSYTSRSNDSIYSNLVRYDYYDKPTNPKTLLKIPGGTGHNGSRIIITNDQKVLWATGDAASDTFSQDSTALNGKILRLNLDGSIPGDNPISNSFVYAWGFRNMQGLTQSPDGKIYTSEHGDAIEDEINWIRPLHNYGWPQIEGMIDTDKEMAIATNSPRTEPIRSWTPVIAPAGLAYYGNKKIPEWNNSLLLTTLKSQSLRILQLSNNGTIIVDEQILFPDHIGRLRSILVTPNGDVFFSTSNRDWNPQSGFPKSDDDIIFRLRPTESAYKQPLTTVKPEIKVLKNGKELYQAYCASCHKDNGQGVPYSFPSLSGSAIVTGPEDKLLSTILYGLPSETTNGSKFNGTMPSFSFLSNEEIAAIATYIRINFDNNAAAVTNNNVQFNR